jgi:hypothetical protein
VIAKDVGHADFDHASFGAELENGVAPRGIAIFDFFRAQHLVGKDERDEDLVARVGAELLVPGNVREPLGERLRIRFELGPVLGTSG